MAASVHDDWWISKYYKEANATLFLIVVTGLIINF